MKIKKRYIFGIVVLLLGAWVSWQYVTRPTRLTAFALGIDHIPKSVHNIEYSEDAWTDYILRIYLEVDPSQFDALLGTREYSKRTVSPSTKHPLGKDSGISPFDVTEVYDWDNGEPSPDYPVSCRIETNHEHDRVLIVYACD